MNYELKFYFGGNTNELVYLGSYPLADEYTYKYYLDLLISKIPFNIWFEFFEDEFINRNFKITARTDFREGKVETDKGSTNVIFITSDDITDLVFLTEAEYKRQDKISELINQLSKEDLTKYFNK